MTAATALGLTAALAAAVSLVLLLVLLHALRRRRMLGAGAALLGALLAMALAALGGAILVGTRGYEALTREELAALVWTVPTGESRFVAHVQLADGRLHTFRLAGDEVYLDAHILKWRPIVNVFGLHTAYELDRVSGRYSRIEDEQTGERTVYSLAVPKPFDFYDLRRRWALLAPLVDAEYGSATFVSARDTAAWQILVSPTGLLARPNSVGTPGD